MSMTRMTSWIFVVSNNDGDDGRRERQWKIDCYPDREALVGGVGHLTEMGAEEKAEQVRFLLAPIKIIDSQDIIKTDNIMFALY